ncbi:MAG TPA: hypothetical protein VGW34_08890 [Allosphingosinicella sp.]|nr:hypothetical protein [Allosphingosinicella sp.]
MNRLSPLIVRKTGRFAPAAVCEPDAPVLTEERSVERLADLKLFATAWAGGTVFVGTFLS